MQVTEQQKPVLSTLALILTLAVLACCAVIIYLLRDIFIPLFLAILAAYIIDPVVDWLSSKKMRRSFAIAVILVTLLLLVAILGLFLIPSLINQTINFVKQIPQYQQTILSLVDKINLPEKAASILSEPLEWLQNNYQVVLQKSMDSMQWVFGIVGGTIAAVVKLIIFFIVFVYVLHDFDRMKETMAELIPRSWKDTTLDVCNNMDELLKNFFRGQLTIGLLMGLLYSIGLFLCGIPFAALIGFSAGICNFVPYFGPLVGLLPSVALSLLAYHTFPVMIYHLLGVIATFSIVQFFEGTFLTPRIVGNKVGLNPVMVILLILVFGKIMGFLGIMLAVPIGCVMKILLQRATVCYKQSDFFLNDK